MEQLPTEILLQILASLQRQERGALANTSRALRVVIIPIVYRVIYIDNQGDFNEYMDTFQTSPDLARHVQILDIRNCPDAYLIFHTFQSVFVNLIRLYFASVNYGARIFDIALLPLWTFLESMSIEERFTPRVMLRVGDGFIDNMYRARFPLLTTLKVHFTGDQIQHWPNIYQERKQQLLFGLILMPNLHHLVLKGMHIAPSDLETLHLNATQLTSLSLLKTTAQAGNGLPPAVVIVGLSNLIVGLSSIEINATVTDLVTYLSLKYENLHSITLSYPKSRELHYDNSRFENQMISFMEFSPTLTICDMEPTHITPNVVQAMHQAEIRLQSLNIYCTSENVGQQLTAIQTSNQRHSINTLKITNSDRAEQRTRAVFDGLAATFAQRLNNFNSLTNLTLYGEYNNLCLTALHSCLGNLRHLQTVLLNNVYIPQNVNVPVIEPCVIASIRIIKLKIQNAQELFNLRLFFRILLPSCPRLETLQLDYKYGNIFRRPQNTGTGVNLNLTHSQHLQSLIFSEHFCHYYAIRRGDNQALYHHHHGISERIDEIPDNQYLPITLALIDHPVLINRKYTV